MCSEHPHSWITEAAFGGGGNPVSPTIFQNPPPRRVLYFINVIAKISCSKSIALGSNLATLSRLYFCPTFDQP